MKIRAEELAPITALPQPLQEDSGASPQGTAVPRHRHLPSLPQILPTWGTGTYV